MNILLRRRHAVNKLAREIEKELKDNKTYRQKSFNLSDIEIFLIAFSDIENCQISQIKNKNRESLIKNIIDAFELKKDFEDKLFDPQAIYAKALFYYWVRYEGLKKTYRVEPTLWKRIITIYRHW